MTLRHDRSETTSIAARRLENATPLVSIGVPVYNGERLLRRTLESLLAQTYTHIEIIISDNASTDTTAAIAREFVERDPRVRYVRNETNIGAIPNFLETLALASGTYFTWTAADDVRPPQAIEACVRALESSPAAVMAHGPIEIELPRQNDWTRIDNCVDMSGARPSSRVRVFTGEVVHVALMFGVHRRDVLQTIRYGNHVAGDYFVCLQMSQRGPIVWVPTPILTYRHKYGALDNPMYERAPITLHDLLLHRGLRRNKCWLVLGIGSYYVWQQGGRHGLAERLRTVWAFASTFVQRFRWALAKEGVFLLFSPASWIAAPLIPVGRRFRRRRTATSMPSQ
jgi:glycosyltransferase involved in cell wall biosynthesis